MRNTIVFCSWTSHIGLEWVHQGCDGDSHLLAEFLNFGTSDFPPKFPCKSASKPYFFVLCRDPVLELQFLTPLRVVLLCFVSRPLQIAL